MNIIPGPVPDHGIRCDDRDRLGEVGVVRLAAGIEITADIVRAGGHAGGVPTVTDVAVGGGQARGDPGGIAERSALVVAEGDALPVPTLAAVHTIETDWPTV